MKYQCIINHLFLIILTLSTTLHAHYAIDPTPICRIYTPDSILEHKEDYHVMYAGDRPRYATCTGAAWFHGNHLALLNLFGQKIITYKWDGQQNNVTQLQEIKYPQMPLMNAENLAFSPNGRLLAICSDKPRAGVNIYKVNLRTHLINPIPVFSIPAHNLIHNVRFTQDGQHLAMAGWDPEAAVTLYKINYDPLEFVQTYTKTNQTEARVKAIYFTKDNRFAVIAYATRISSSSQLLNRYIIHVYKFNRAQGKLGRLVSSVDDPSCLGNVEDILFLPDDKTLVLSDQGKDVLTMHAFDPIKGIIDSNGTQIQNPEAHLSFPHGMSLSPDEKFLAVTNYGDDSCNIYQIHKEEE